MSSCMYFSFSVTIKKKIFHPTFFKTVLNRYTTMTIILQILLSFCLFRCVTTDFSPDKTDYNAYGLKMIVNDLTEFLIQFSPYTDDIENSTNRSCSIEYDNESIQSVHIHDVLLFHQSYEL